MISRPTLRPRSLAHPVPLAALIVLVANDHWWKGAGLLPGWLTGKLSDFAGLVFFPVLLTALVELGWRRARRPVVAVAATAVTGLSFTLLKVWEPANRLANEAWGSVALDPTDLVALPSLLLALHHLLALPVKPAPRVVQAAVVVFASLASIATSAPMTRRGYAVWQLDPREQMAGCARVRPFVAKSGKEGVGIGVRVASPDPGCTITLSGVLRAGGRAYASDAPVTQSAPGHAYVAFAFDDEAVWNDGVREGSLELLVRDPRGESRVTFPMRYVHEGDHPYARRHGEPAGATSGPQPPPLEVPAPRPEIGGSP